MRGSTLVTRLSLLALFVSFAGCGGGAPKRPAWFLNPPDDPSYYVAASSGESMREQLAINKAKTTAQADISQQIEARVGNMTKQFQEEVGAGENSELLESFTSVTKVVTKTVLSGVKTKEVATFPQKNGSWTAYVLMVLPKAELAAQMMNEAKKQEVLYNRFRASQAYDELQKEMQEYEKKEGQ